MDKNMRSPSTGGSMEEDKVPAGDDGAMERSIIKHEEEVAPDDASGAIEGTNPDDDQEAAGGEGAIKPEEEAAAAGGGVPGLDDWEREFRDEMDRTLLYEKLLAGPKLKKKGTIKKVRIEGEAIERLLQVRPRHAPKPKPMPFPEDFHLLPTGLRLECLRSLNKAREAWEYEQYIIDQYFDKGYAEVHRYVFDDGSMHGGRDCAAVLQGSLP